MMSDWLPVPVRRKTKRENRMIIKKLDYEVEEAEVSGGDRFRQISAD